MPHIIIPLLPLFINRFSVDILTNIEEVGDKNGCP